MTELRRTKRMAWVEEVEVLAPRPCTGRSIDLAEGGIGLELPVVLTPGELVELRLFQGHVLQQGRVRWVRPTPAGCRAGLQFPEEDWAIVQRVQALRSASA